MACGCEEQPAKSEAERRTLHIAFALNVTMFVVGTVGGILAESTGVLADALDMLADGCAYGIALMAVTRGIEFKRNAARVSGGVLLLLGLGILVEVIRRWMVGSEPQGALMMGFAVASLIVNVTVLRMLGRFRRGEVHLRATWLFTRVDVIANLAVFASGLLVALTGTAAIDLVVGSLIGLYVVKEAIEILREAREGSDDDE